MAEAGAITLDLGSKDQWDNEGTDHMESTGLSPHTDATGADLAQHYSIQPSSSAALSSERRLRSQKTNVGRLGDVDVSTPAVILKFDYNIMHHGGLGVIRSLGRLGVPVYGVHEAPWAPAASSRYLQGRFFWNPDPSYVARVHDGLLRVAEHLRRPAVLITTDDAGSIFLAEHGESLREAFLFPRPRADLPRRLAGKYTMFQTCSVLGIPTPKTVLPTSRAQVNEFAGQTGLPLVAKLATPWRDGKVLDSTTILRTHSELDAFCAACETAGADFILQEYVPGVPGQDWFFHGYCDAMARCQPRFTGVKDRSYPALAGMTSLGRWVPNAVLSEQVTGLLSRMSYSGIVDLDLRFDRRDGEYKLLDFNPRLGAQFRLFEDSCGVDVVRAAYLDLTGQPIPVGEPIADRRFLVENCDPISAISHWRRGELGLSAWTKSLRGVREAAWFAPDDLRPFWLMCLRMGVGAVNRRISGYTGRMRRVADAPCYRPGRMAERHFRS